MVELPDKREAAKQIREIHPEISERRAAKLVCSPRSSMRHKPNGNRGKEMKQRVYAAAMKHARYGHRRIAGVLTKQLGRPVSRRNVQRIMQKLELQVRTRRRRKWAARAVASKEAPKRADERWAMDFVSDWCVGVGRQLRLLTMVDCCTREALATEAGYSMPAAKVVQVLENLRKQNRKPVEIRVDNGPEFISSKLVNWCKLHDVRLSYIERGKPYQNGHAESFNGRFRDECLNGHYFLDLDDARRKIDPWRMEYLTERPHSSLGGKTPAEVAKSLGVRTPFAAPDFRKANSHGRQGDPAGALRAALTAARLGLGGLLSRRRAY